MTTITLPRAVVEQVLEAINDTAYGAPVFRQEVRDTITTLRAALAQHDPQDPELSAALGWPGGISDPVLDRKTLLQQVAALRAVLAQQAEPETCTWHQDGDSDSGVYATSCRRFFNLTDGTPEDNKMQWCCYCGKKLVQELITEGDDE